MCMRLCMCLCLCICLSLRLSLLCVMLMLSGQSGSPIIFLFLCVRVTGLNINLPESMLNSHNTSSSLPHCSLTSRRLCGALDVIGSPPSTCDARFMLHQFLNPNVFDLKKIVRLTHTDAGEESPSTAVATAPRLQPEIPMHDVRAASLLLRLSQTHEVHNHSTSSVDPQ